MTATPPGKYWTINRAEHGLGRPPGMSTRTAWAVIHSAIPRLLALRWTGPCVVGASMLIATFVVGHMFGVRVVLSALASANPALLLAAVGLGITNELLRAQRARLVLQCDRPISFAQSYAPMVLGHGLGDSVPVVPAGPALRALLTERIAGIPVSFAVGAHTLEGIFDTLGLGALTIYLLWVLPLPGWVHATLAASLLQGLCLVLVLLGLTLSTRLDRFRSPRFARFLRILRPAAEVVRGLRALLEQSVFTAMRVTMLSFLLFVVAVLQLLLFLRAFHLVTSPNLLLLVLVLTMAAGSLPIKLPGFGTVAATMALQAAQIHGTGVGGYILLSRVVASSLTPALALLLLAWWMATGRTHHLNLRAVLRRVPTPPVAPSEPSPAQVHPGVTSMVSMGCVDAIPMPSGRTTP